MEIKEEYNDETEVMKSLNQEKKVKAEKVYWFKLGETIANGIIYFGARTIEKRSVFAKCICPCGEDFRAKLSDVASGKVKSCERCKR